MLDKDVSACRELKGSLGHKSQRVDQTFYVRLALKDQCL